MRSVYVHWHLAHPTSEFLSPGHVGFYCRCVLSSNPTPERPSFQPTDLAVQEIISVGDRGRGRGQLPPPFPRIREKNFFSDKHRAIFGKLIDAKSVNLGMDRVVTCKVFLNFVLLISKRDFYVYLSLCLVNHAR